MPIVSLPVTASMEFPASQTQPLRRPALNGILPQLDPDPDPGLVLDTQSGPQSGRVIPKTVSRPNCRLRRYAHDSFDFMSLRRANIVPFPIIHPRSSPKPHPQTSFQPPHALLKSFPSLLLNSTLSFNNLVCRFWVTNFSRSPQTLTKFLTTLRSKLGDSAAERRKSKVRFMRNGSKGCFCLLGGARKADRRRLRIMKRAGEE